MVRRYSIAATIRKRQGEYVQCRVPHGLPNSNCWRRLSLRGRRYLVSLIRAVDKSSRTVSNARSLSAPTGLRSEPSARWCLGGAEVRRSSAMALLEQAVPSHALASAPLEDV